MALTTPFFFALGLYLTAYSLWPASVWPFRPPGDWLVRAAGVLIGAGIMAACAAEVLGAGDVERTADAVTKVGGLLLLIAVVRMRLASRQGPPGLRGR